MIIPGARQLFTPLNYLRIRRKTVKPWYDWYIPGGLTVVTVALICLAGIELNVFGKGGLIQQITELLKMLIGFYIAALAAVSTFPSAVLDQALQGEPTTLKVTRRGCDLSIPLSRRRFLSYLFGYLAFLSLALFIVGTISMMSAGSVKGLVPTALAVWVKAFALALYLFWVFNLLIGTLLGLHYLSDRIHRPLDGNVATHSSERGSSSQQRGD